MVSFVFLLLEGGLGGKRPHLLVCQVESVCNGKMQYLRYGSVMIFNNEGFRDTNCRHSALSIFPSLFVSASSNVCSSTTHARYEGFKKRGKNRTIPIQPAFMASIRIRGGQRKLGLGLQPQEREQGNDLTCKFFILPPLLNFRNTQSRLTSHHQMTSKLILVWKYPRLIEEQNNPPCQV